MARDHIYTRQGDQGDTGLLSGERVRKDCPVTEACGTVDELTSLLGLVVVEINDIGLADEVKRIQGTLLEIGACVASAESGVKMPGLRAPGEAAVKHLEAAIDRLSDALPQQDHFLIPGGSRAAATTHVARAVCRRAERRVVSLLDCAPSLVLEQVLVYLNRLSDYLYVLARTCNRLDGVPDTPWQREG